MHDGDFVVNDWWDRDVRDRGQLIGCPGLDLRIDCAVRLDLCGGDVLERLGRPYGGQGIFVYLHALAFDELHGSMIEIVQPRDVFVEPPHERSHVCGSNSISPCEQLRVGVGLAYSFHETIQVV